MSIFNRKQLAKKSNLGYQRTLHWEDAKQKTQVEKEAYKKAIEKGASEFFGESVFIVSSSDNNTDNEKRVDLVLY